MNPSHDPTRLSGVETTQRPGYPLALLFLAVAVSAVLLAMDAAAISSVQQHFGDALGQALAGVVVGCFWGGCFGAILGVFHHRRARGAGLGALSGAGTGALIGPLCVAPQTSGERLAVTSLFGSLLIVALGLLIRRTVARAPRQMAAIWPDKPLVAEVVSSPERGV
jgi:hypothetical protein